MLADELIEPLRARGRSVIRASIDGFHNPREIRHQQGRDCPKGYYEDDRVLNLAEDVGEQNNLAEERPEVLAELIEIAARSRVPSEVFPSAFDPPSVGADTGGDRR